MSRDKLIPLGEAEKQKFRDRLEEVMNQRSGLQVIVLYDSDHLTDTYQNICVKHLVDDIDASASDYSLKYGIIQLDCEETE